ncbi:uncharacterized protein LOC5513722 [Nematostella vectensis]|uniref:uncharacterized protein LOC5513722 n=1 Tax=Nematostella vectensis TaxID=45351 RepID=UPI0020773745|nr:uncharacterized protein LOC5513722 [Nematostella vectensis]
MSGKEEKTFVQILLSAKITSELLEKKRYELLSSFVDGHLANEVSTQGSRVRRYVQRPDWTKHPLFPLYPIDYTVCKNNDREEKFGLCKIWKDLGFCRKRKYIMKKFCQKECGLCKALAPPICQSTTYGCCWDNTIAEGPNGQGCPACYDRYPHTCKQFDDYCIKPGRNGRFIRYHCFNSCGRCAMQAGYAAKNHRA